MNRKSKIQANLEIAFLISRRGKCGRAQVGCLITNDGRIVASGYNGPIHPIATCDYLECDLTKPCEHSIHAEANAIAFAARVGIRLEGTTMYCTHGPCEECANLIVQSGIRELYYWKDFRDEKGISILLKNGVLAKKYEIKNN